MAEPLDSTIFIFYLLIVNIFSAGDWCSVIQIRNLNTVTLIACMNYLTVTDVNSNMANIAGTTIEY